MKVFAIGHGKADANIFVGLLRQHEIGLLVGTRTQPYSRFNSQFNRETIKPNVNAARIAYAFMGESLGGRPKGEQFYFPSGK